MTISVLPLGSGCEVGRSCILVTLNNFTIMLDCGLHMGFSDHQKFPDFTYLDPQDLNTKIDVVIITHFHLDHCGALPWLTEVAGYNGPIFMTHPTKAICPLLLEDYKRINVEKNGPNNMYTTEMIKACMKKVTPVSINQRIYITPELYIRGYYAGHVLGAGMFQVVSNGESFVYTGDYNSTPDNHLESAWIDDCKPDVLITETTYATTVRGTREQREIEFLEAIHNAVKNNGKVLIPVFALGRAQELCMVIENYWHQHNLKAPIYFSAGMTSKATDYYKLFINWTNEHVKHHFEDRNMFDFEHIKPFTKAFASDPGPMVLLASPGMLHAGLSLEVFKLWAHEPNNLLILPGYCVSGTVGHKVLSGAKKIEIDQDTTIHVNLDVQHLSFSAHADQVGIMTLIKQCKPKNVVLVHGDVTKMVEFKKHLESTMNIPTYHPLNGQSLHIHQPYRLPVRIERELVSSYLAQGECRVPNQYVDIPGVLFEPNVKNKLTTIKRNPKFNPPGR